jgi:hypothetical protein
MQVPDQTLYDIVSYCNERFGLSFTKGEIQSFCDGADISQQITEGWPDTDERELFLDALAEKMTGRHWPINAEDVPEFPVMLIRGYLRWRWGDLRIGEKVRFIKHRPNERPCRWSHGHPDRLYSVTEKTFDGPDQIDTGTHWIRVEEIGRVGLFCVEREIFEKH